MSLTEAEHNDAGCEALDTWASPSDDDTMERVGDGQESRATPVDQATEAVRRLPVGILSFGDECGVGMITTSLRERYPFVKVP